MISRDKGKGKPSGRSQQHPQMWVFTHKWVEMHNKINKLEQEVKYWMIEAQTDHDRWLGALEDLDKLRKQYEVLPVNPKNKTKVRRNKVDSR